MRRHATSVLAREPQLPRGGPKAHDPKVADRRRGAPAAAPPTGRAAGKGALLLLAQSSSPNRLDDSGEDAGETLRLG